MLAFSKHNALAYRCSQRSPLPKAIKRRLFQLSWRIVCGGVFNQTSGDFTSPGYPLAYRNNLQCDYKLAVQPNDYVVIEFVPPFELEQCKSVFFHRIIMACTRSSYPCNP